MLSFVMLIVVDLEDVPCLLVGEFAALDVVGVISKINLSAVVDAAADYTFFFFSESFEKGRVFHFVVATGGQIRIGRQTPGLAGEKSPGHFPGRRPPLLRHVCFPPPEGAEVTVLPVPFVPPALIGHLRDDAINLHSVLFLGDH